MIDEAAADAGPVHEDHADAIGCAEFHDPVFEAVERNVAVLDRQVRSSVEPLAGIDHAHVIAEAGDIIPEYERIIVGLDRTPHRLVNEIGANKSIERNTRE